MAKYSLGTATTKISSKVSKDTLYLNSSKANSIVSDMKTQFETISSSLSNINSLMNKAVNKKVVTGDYATAFKGWAKKAKSQATAATKRKSTLSSKYTEDTKNYTIKLLSDRISALESKIAKMADN